jgi:hypothetical protein
MEDETMAVRLLEERVKRGVDNTNGGKTLSLGAAAGLQPRSRQVEGIAGGEIVADRRPSPRPAVMRDCPGFGIFCVFCDGCSFIRRGSGG